MKLNQTLYAAVKHGEILPTVEGPIIHETKQAVRRDLAIWRYDAKDSKIHVIKVAIRPLEKHPQDQQEKPSHPTSEANDASKNH